MPKLAPATSAPAASMAPAPTRDLAVPLMDPRYHAARDNEAWIKCFTRNTFRTKNCINAIFSLHASNELALLLIASV